MKVIFGQKFTNHYQNFTKSDQDKINKFIYHISRHGLTNLTGRNKSSDNVPTDDPNWAAKVAYAKKHQLWHYHIGIPDYHTASNGDQVSEYVLHYILGDDFIKIVELDSHPPMNLPNVDYLS